MTTKQFRTIGVLATIAIVAGTFFAFATIQDRARNRIDADDEVGRRGPDSIALLSADVVAMREDLRALHDVLETRLTAALGDFDGATAESLERSRADLARLTADVAALRAALERSVAARNAGERDALTAAPQPAAAAVDGASAGEPAPAESPREPGAPASPSVAPKQRFLSFELPSSGFAFDRRQRFAVVPTLSRVGFDARSTLHDFSGVTSTVEGEFETNLAHPQDLCRGCVRASAITIDTGLASRNEAMHEILRPAAFPHVRFQWSTFVPQEVDAQAQRVSGVVKGVLSIRDVEREISMPVRVAVDASQRIAIEGQTTLRLSDFGVRPPSKLGLISVDDDATLWIALRARTMGASAEKSP